MKRIQTLIIFVMLAAVSLPVQAEAVNKDWALSSFVKATFLYKDGEYAKAAEVYEDILRNHWESGALYYNLGNSYFKQGQLGRALLNYERAGRLLPRDADLLTNRKFALQKAQRNFSVPAGSFFPGPVFQQLDKCSVDELALLFICALVFLAGVHLCSLFLAWPRRQRNLSISVLLALVVLFAGLLGVKLQADRDAGIMLAEGECLFEPRQQATVHFQLREGERVRVMKEEGAWAKVRRPDGKQGWVHKEKLEKI